MHKFTESMSMRRQWCRNEENAFAISTSSECAMHEHVCGKKSIERMNENTRMNKELY